MNVSNYWLLFIFFGIISCDSSPQKVSAEATSGVKENHDIKPIYHPSHEPGRQNNPFSDVVQVGHTYYLTGQIGLDHSNGTLVAGGIKAETAQTLENIKAVLSQHDLSMTQVVKATVILSDINDFAVFNEIYKSYFPQKPARTTFAAAALARDAKIEIEVVAVGKDN